MDVYTLRKDKESGEIHIFKGKDNTRPCTASNTSICGKMKQTVI